MKTFLATLALASTAAAAPALAADLRMPVKAAPAPAAVMYNWSGFYIGGHAGYGWGDSTFDSVGVVPATSTEHRIRGFVGGGHTGFNWQTGQFVFGIEGSVSLSRMDGSSVCPTPTFRCETDVDHFWRVGGRAGFAAGPTGNWLFYGTGGFARAKIETRTPLIATGVSAFSDTTHHHGWFAGGGIEWGFAPNFTIGVEAYHVSLGAERHFLPGGAIVAGATRDVDTDFSVVTARATYKFDWGGPLVARY